MPSVRPAPRSTLVGRDRELADLFGLLRATADGVGGCVVLTGPPGIGKTRMLTEVQRHALVLGLAVAPGRASELDRLAPLTSLLSAVRAAVPRPVDLSALRDHDGDRLWYVDRLGEALEEYVTGGPLLVVVDDAHWADELSALALRVLVPRLASTPLRWLLARWVAPPESVGHAAIDRLVEEGADQIHLGPLDEDAVHLLCANVLDATPDATVLSLAAQGRGNPFLLEQFLTALKDTGQIHISDGIASVIGSELPSGLPSAVEQRLRGLSGEARALLRAGSIFQRAFTVHEAARLLGLPATRLMPAAEEAVSAEVLLAQDTRLVYAHDLWRQAMYNSVSGPVRATMHHEAALAAQEQGRPAVEVAVHLVKAGLTGDRGAGEVVRVAAEEMATRAPSTAADLVLDAWRMLSGYDEERSRLSATAVGLLASAGRVAEARELGEATLRSGLDPRTRTAVLLGLAEALKHAGQNRAAADYAQRALAEPAAPQDLQARLHAIRAHALLFVDDLPEADRAGAEADRLGQATGEYAASAFGSTARCTVARSDGRLSDAVGYARRAVTVADTAGGPALQQHPRIWLGDTLTAMDRFDEAEQAYAVGRRMAENLGTGWSQPLWHFYTANLLAARGRLDDAEAEAQAGVHIAEELTALQLCVPLRGLLTRVAILRGQLPVAHGHLRAMERLCNDGITAAPEEIAWSTSALQMADGQPAAALRTLGALYRWVPGRLLMFSNDPAAGPELVRIALAVGARAPARAVAEAVRLLADRNPEVTSLAGAAAHAEGLLHRDLAALRRGVDRFRDSPRPLARARAMEDTARAENEAGRRDRAVRLLQEAIEECARCGACGPVDRMAKALRQLGVRAPAAEPAPALPQPLAGLTATELNLARLVASGLTNKEIAERIGRSPHTVDSHLRNIFSKVNVNSRVALTRIVLGGDRP
ncbi:MAG: hypothetical protein AUI14_16885 [Actinobacteria bacterium 13_2_20CM_2_71_6]|nr:MAG: hypothetical protein AUI14_16885 [Actinobacteria bacterium 13_2_20CM_2_71_6]